MPRSFAYVSAAAAGAIDVFALDGAGRLERLATVHAGVGAGPMALSPDRRRLYVAIRSEPFRVATFAIDGATGGLAAAAEAPLPASMPYLAVAAEGRLLLAASYQSDCAAALRIDADGSVRDAAAQVLPTGRHAHAILPDRSGRFVLVPCLGSDEIRVFRLDGEGGRLAPHDPPSVSLPGGFGPRHLVWSLDNRRLFVLSEFTGEIARFRFDAAAGKLDLIDLTATVPADSGLRPGSARGPVAAGEPDRSSQVWAADLQMTTDGRFLYATERTRSMIAMLACDAADGAPRILGHAPTEAQPRGIRIDPTGRWLVASGERSDHIACYGIDAGTGRLSPASRAPVSAGANWVEIAAFD